MASLLKSTASYELLREEMKRSLTPEEQLTYRGITISAMTGRKYDQLFGIETAEELIAAELYGRDAIPSDDPGNLYLFSLGHGLTARYNTDYHQAALASESEEEKALGAASVPNRTTIAEMHNRYLNTDRPAAPEDLASIEAQLAAVANDFVPWWNQLLAKQDSLDRRQQGYCCNDQGQHCGVHRHVICESRSSMASADL